jgi:putative endonuclease
VQKPWQIYILRCGDGSLYTGIARDAHKRLAQHRAGKGARYTRGRAPLALIYVEEAASHGEALRREAGIRRLGRSGKELLAASFTPCSGGSERGSQGGGS